MMISNTLKKLSLRTLSAATLLSLALSSTAFAENATGFSSQYSAYGAKKSSSDSGSKDVVSAINTLAKKMVALSMADIGHFNQAMYQFNQNLVNAVQNNLAQKQAADTGSSATQETNNRLASQLSTIPNAILSSSRTAEGGAQVAAAIQAEQNQIKNLTINTPASDTLYSNEKRIYSTGQTDLYIGPPKTIHDNAMSLTAIIDPSTYEKGALSDPNSDINKYISYLTKSYNNPASALNLADFKSYLSSLESNKDKAQAIENLIKNKDYQNYQLIVRSNMATQSIALHALAHLMSERMPSQENVQGIKAADGTDITHPSSLAVDRYQSNYRIEDPQWAQSLQQLSTANLMREIALELSYSLHQNYQAHLDREQILATLAGMHLQNLSNSDMLASTQARQVNDYIKNLGQSAT